mgnify:CR=1 FL=1
MTDENNQNSQTASPNVPPMIQPQCPACGAPEQIVWVHGHGQCAHCKMNVMPCCDGAVCDPPTGAVG